jgi:hypothetical protein
MATLFLFQNLITVYPFFLQILVFALMTANLLLKAQAQTNPVVTTVLGNGGVTYLTIPVILNPAGGGTVTGVVPVVPGVGTGATGTTGLTQNLGVSKLLNIQ